MNGYVKTWRTTDNALENTCALHSDTFLCLDEISQVNEKVLGAITYMISGEQSKGRSKRDGSERPNKTWRSMFLSTGEQTFADKLMEGGKTPRAGQAVRLLDISADAGAGLGVFEDLHGSPSPQVFADAIKAAAATHYGHVGPMFIEGLIKHGDTIKGFAKELPALAEKLSGSNADGQVKRAAMRFALVAVAGLLAIHFGILPVSVQEVWGAVKKCFKDWLDARGGQGALEDLQIVERLKDFLATHGASRFENLDLPPLQVVHNRAGFKSAKTGCTDYYVNDVTFKKEICQGMDAKKAEEVLVKEGFLIRDGGHFKSKLPKDHPEAKRTRHYKFSIPDIEPVTDTEPAAPVQITLPPGWKLPTMQDYQTAQQVAPVAPQWMAELCTQ